MCDESVTLERKIARLPRPYKPECTPYRNFDFGGDTHQKCLIEKHNKDSWTKICKVIVIGDVSVGKTCIVNRFCQKIFDTNYKSTIGVDFEIQHFNILGVPFSLQIWDTAGQERFKSIAQSYYRGAGVIMVVFDLTNFESLSNCHKWLQESLNANTVFSPLIFLVGTKMDLLGTFAVKNVESMAMKIAKHLGAEYWTVSSKNGKNIDKLFLRIAALTFEECIQKEILDEKERSVKIGQNLPTEKQKTDDESKCIKCQMN